ncbi:hypothetical protein [Staphylococcus epidermidis]
MNRSVIYMLNLLRGISRNN